MNANLCQSTNMRIEDKGDDIIHRELSYKITGACFGVQNQLGRWLTEKQYADTLAVVFDELGILYEREFPVELAFDNKKIGGINKVDFLIDQKIVLELKAKHFISKDDYYQTKRYLHALNKKLGIIVNFRDKRLRPKRVINSSGE